MEFLQHLATSLKRGRTAELPPDFKQAFYLLMPMVIANQHRSVSDLLCKSKYDVSYSCGRAHRSLLHIAANCGSYECLCLLLKKGAGVNTQDVSGCTALHLAARNGHLKCLNKLLEVKSDTNIRNNEGLTAIHWLAVNGRTELLQALFQHVRDVDIEDSQGQTALHVACQNGHKSTLLCLIDNGASVNRTNHNGWTALHFACSHGQHDAASILLQRKAQITLENFGKSPMDLSTEGGYGETCEVLLQFCPRLLSALLQSVQKPYINEESLLKVLSYLSKEDKHVKERILPGLAEQASLLGHRVLSVSGDGEADVTSLLKCVNIMQKLSAQQHSQSVTRLTESARQRSSSQESGSSNTDLTTPAAFHQFQPLETLWQLLEDWLHFMYQEMEKPQNIEKEKHSSSTSVIDENHTNLAASKTTESVSNTSQELQDSSSGTKTTDHAKNSKTMGIENHESLDASMKPEVISNSSQKVPDGSQSESVSGNDKECKAVGTENTANVPTTSHGLHSSLPGGLAAVHDVEGKAVRNESLESSQRTNIAAKSHEVPDNSSRTGHQEDKYKQTDTPMLDIKDRERSQSVGTMLREQDIVTAAFPRICALIQAYYVCSRSSSEDTLSCSAENDEFFSFVHRHLPVLRMLVAREPKLIFRHFNFLLDCSSLMPHFLPVIRLQSFDMRRQWFYDNLGPDDHDSLIPNTQDLNMITVSRERLFHTSCKEVLKKSPSLLKQSFLIQFDGEDGVGHGVVREWFDILSKEILNPDYALFTQSADGCTFQPNSNSSINPDHLSYFQFAGQALGLAVYHRQILSVYFTRSFYKHILGIPVNYTDVASIDPEYAKNLQWILDHDISELGLDLTFSVETDVFGVMEEVDLIPNGREIAVTEDNKREYVQLVTELRMTQAIKPQIESFLSGFHEYIPHGLVQLFDEYELELLVSGLPEIDLEDWRTNISYTGYSETSPVIQWFWQIVSEFSQQERVLLLQFVTGSSRVPYGGFSNFSSSGFSHPFTISHVNSSSNSLPTASTCINLLKLPEYPSKKVLQKMLNIALQCGSQGYGLV
ncbi:E3 ubiquitin-protein ligase HACE1-like [Gigantopelta aegis]|uniref:E3 ubiquitin-protein ligase HACE1-like n=1 Tax=Gigantopelta aegis TaxID=1735272 RepID=UPI001B88BC77|nr:E3 ubiquitin-protein ligase HACE1-like [Gigantopelta aegis]